MLNVYNWETNTIDLTDKYNNHYNLKLRGNKNIVKGSSGTGKSYLYNMILKIKQRMDKTSKYCADNIFLVSLDNKDKLDKLNHKLIIIDKAELLLDEKDINIINTDDNNRYLIFSRDPLGIEVSPNHQADMVNENGTTTLRYPR